tara:strand:+ start:323 stop:703 length:381 start_codon:yes stop_codon:yes gene_type:complete
MSMLQTEYEFTLPKGFVDIEGNLHKQGVMRLATSMDEITPLRDSRVKSNEAYLSIIILSRVITQLGTLGDMNTGVIEKMYTADLAYLQDFYNSINEGGDSLGKVTCPSCESEFDVQPGELLAPAGV